MSLHATPMKQSEIAIETNADGENVIGHSGKSVCQRKIQWDLYRMEVIQISDSSI